MPGSTASGAGSAAAGSQSLPSFASPACTEAPTRPSRATTCNAALVVGEPVRVDSSTGTVVCGGTVMSSPPGVSNGPSLPASSRSTTAWVESGLVRWT